MARDKVDLKRETAQHRAEEERLGRLVRQGFYWEVLGLEPGSSVVDVTHRILELRGEFPRLGAALNRVQTTLTQKRDAFRRACTTRDRTVIEIQRKFGPQLLAMKATAGGVSWTWLEVLWQRLEKSFVGASSTNRGVKIRQLKRDFIGDVERFVESLQDIDIAVSDAQIGKAVCVWTKSRYCPKCKGKHRVTLSGWQLFIEADKNRRLQEQLREALGETDFTKLWAEFERLLKGEIVAWMQQPPDFMVDRLSCEIVCPHCCEEFTFDIPSYVEEGWILKGTTLREDSTRYVRVKKLVKPKLLLD